MTIEAELKAVVRDPEGVLKQLEERHGAGRAEVYRDTYDDAPDGSLMGADRELRIRTVHSPDDTRTVLTYKSARVDQASGSKPEVETRVEDADATHEIVRALGFVPRIAFEKRPLAMAGDSRQEVPKKLSRICCAASPAGSVPART